MSNNNTPDTTDTKSGFKLLFRIAATLDVIWALLIASYYAFVVNTAAGLAGASAGTLSIGTVLSFVLAFMVALFQGAIFIVVFGIFAILLYAIYKNLTTRS